MKRPRSLYNNDNLQLSAQSSPRSTKRPKLSLRARPFSKNLVAFHQRCGERKSDHFLRRHVRLRKYRSACKRASWPPGADSACAAVRPQNPCQKVILFDRLKAPEAFASGAPLVYRLHGHPAGQCVGDRVHDFLCLFFAAALKDVGGEVEADMDGSSEFGHVTLPLSSDFRRRPTQQTAPDGWYCRLQVIL